MREPSWSFVPTAKCGLSRVGACQNSVLSSPPPPALVGLYWVSPGGCAIPALASRRLANGADRPRPSILPTSARRDARPAFAAAMSSRSSRSFIKNLPSPRNHVSRYQSFRFQKSLSQPLGVAFSWRETAATQRRLTIGMTAWSSTTISFILMINAALPLVFLGRDLPRDELPHEPSGIRLPHQHRQHLQVGVELSCSIRICRVGREKNRRCDGF